MFIEKPAVLAYFSYLLICVFALTLKFTKKYTIFFLFYSGSHEIGHMSRT